MLINNMLERQSDNHGSGYYGARRGSRTHQGVDLCVLPNTSIQAPISGKITKLGYPYADKLQYRYVEISTSRGYRYRLFYVEPSVSVDDVVLAGDNIGHSQELGVIYSGITEHIHFEIMNKQGKRIDPMPFVERCWDEG